MSTEVLRHWFDDKIDRIVQINSGLLNQTYLVDHGPERFVLQKLNPIFAPEVNEDIDALTQHLEKKGLQTPRLVKTQQGKLWCMVDGQCFRLMTFVQGDNFDSLKDPTQAAAAGSLVGSFHRAVVDFEHNYRFARLNVHDTQGHLAKLEAALGRFPDHAMQSEVAPLAEQILRAAKGLEDLSALPKRHSHGDLKINNLIFGHPQGSLIDLDTIGKMPWPIEMGDAFRSWCNPKGEDASQVYFDEALFEAAIVAYARAVRGLWSDQEIALLPDAIATIPLELSSRFLRDVLEDCYFGYDAKRFESRAAHNLLRAQGQWSLSCDIAKKKASISQLLKRAFA